MGNEISPTQTITWKAEGPYSKVCKIHFPPQASGATIGKGYDFKFHTLQQVEGDFRRINVGKIIRQELKFLAGLSAQRAKRVVSNSNSLSELRLTNSQIRELYFLVYKRKITDAIRLTKHTGNISRYGNPNWQSMPVKLKELVVDLTYRGDYSSFKGAKRIPDIQKFIVNRDYAGLHKFYSNDNNMSPVNKYRWNLRKMLAQEMLNDNR